MAWASSPNESTCSRTPEVMGEGASMRFVRGGIRAIHRCAEQGAAHQWETGRARAAQIEGAVPRGAVGLGVAIVRRTHGGMPADFVQTYFKDSPWPLAACLPCWTISPPSSTTWPS